MPEQVPPPRGLRKRSFTLSGHRTSIALEPEFWAALEAWAAERKVPLSRVVIDVDGARGERPLASCLRVSALLRATSD